jgi:type IV secretion system protein VirD4
MDRARPLAPVLIGHALDEAVSHKGEQLGLGL